MRETGLEEKARKHSKNSDVGTPMIQVLFLWPSKSPAAM